MPKYLMKKFHDFGFALKCFINKKIDKSSAVLNQCDKNMGFILQFSLLDEVLMVFP